MRTGVRGRCLAWWRRVPRNNTRKDSSRKGRRTHGGDELVTHWVRGFRLRLLVFRGIHAGGASRGMAVVPVAPAASSVTWYKRYHRALIIGPTEESPRALKSLSHESLLSVRLPSGIPRCPRQWHPSCQEFPPDPHAAPRRRGTPASLDRFPKRIANFTPSQFRYLGGYIRDVLMLLGGRREGYSQFNRRFGRQSSLEGAGW